MPIDLPAQVQSGTIDELVGTAEGIARVLSAFDPSFVGGIHAGEAEGLALVLTGATGDAQFCSGDALAIQALAMLGLAERAVSFEALLGGKKTEGRLPHEYTESYLNRYLDIGRERRITGAGLRKALLD